MKRLTAAVRSVAVVVAALALAACEPLDDGGGAGVDGPLTFESGFVFVRGSAGDVFLVNASEPNVAQQLTSGGSARHPALSRDGRRVVFARFSGTASELVTVGTAQGATPAVLLTAAGTGNGQNLRFPTFSPSGSTVVFVYDVGQTSFLGQVNADGTGFTQLAGSASRSYGAPFFLRDGSAVLAPAGLSRLELDGLDQVNLSPRTVFTLTNNLNSNSEGSLTVVNRVVLSPDGTRLAFDARSSAGVTRVYVAAFSGSVVQPAERLSSESEGEETFPTWTSAASVGLSSNLGGQDNVYTASATALRGSLILAVPSAREPWFGPL